MLCLDKGDVRFAAFPSHFFIYEVQGSEFCMSMSDHIATEQQVLQEFFAKKVSDSPGKRQNWILLFYQSGRTSTHIETILPIWSRGSVAHCFNLLHMHVRYRTTEITAPNR